MNKITISKESAKPRAARATPQVFAHYHTRAVQRTALQTTLAQPSVMPKLFIGPSNDRHEREADAIDYKDTHKSL